MLSGLLVVRTLILCVHREVRTSLYLDKHRLLAPNTPELLYAYPTDAPVIPEPRRYTDGHERLVIGLTISNSHGLQ